MAVNIGHKSVLYMEFMYLNSFQTTFFLTSTALHYSLRIWSHSNGGKMAQLDGMGVEMKYHTVMAHCLMYVMDIDWYCA